MWLSLLFGNVYLEAVFLEISDFSISKFSREKA